MHTVLIYDIGSDRARAKVADACLDYGLQRIQYSAFFGEISANHLEELLQRIRRLLGRGEAKVEVFPVCQKDLRLRRSLTSARLARTPRPGRRKEGPEEAAGPPARDPTRELLEQLEALPEEPRVSRLTAPARKARRRKGEAGGEAGP